MPDSFLSGEDICNEKPQSSGNKAYLDRKKVEGEGLDGGSLKKAVEEEHGCSHKDRTEAHKPIEDRGYG